MLFPFAFMGTLALVYGYVGWRTISPARLSRTWKRCLWALVACLWILAPLPILLRRLDGESPSADNMAWISNLGLGFFFLAFCMLAAADLVRLAALILRRVTRFAMQGFTGATAPDTPVDPGRRRLLAYPVNLGILGVTAGLSGYGFIEAIQIPDVVRVRVPIPNLPPALEGYRIVQMTDIHIGPMIKQKFTGAIVDRANALEPDLIALTGDVVDGSVGHLSNAVSPLSALSARHGTYFVTGNHEYYSGAEVWIDEFDRLGLRVLLNDHRMLQIGDARILLAGVTDPNGGRFVDGHHTDLDAAISGATPADVKLLLAHQPRSIFAAARRGFDLQLSGHTHGGQFIPWNFIVELTQPYLKGLHNHQNTWIYVSKGTGYLGPPLRLGTKPEITLIELTSQTRQESA